MAKQIYWSITVPGCNSSTPPPGLSCAGQCNTLVVLYVQDQSDPSVSLVDTGHPDVVLESSLRTRRVAVVIAKVLNATFLNGKWTYQFEYDETAFTASDLQSCDICQAECLTCEVQSKLKIAVTAPGSGSGDTTTFEEGLATYLEANEDIDCPESE